MTEKSLPELFKEYYEEQNKNFLRWKTYEFIEDKKNYQSAVDDELENLMRDWILDSCFEEDDGQYYRVYWLTHDWPSFGNRSPYDCIKNGHAQMVKNYVESKLMGLPE